MSKNEIYKIDNFRAYLLRVGRSHTETFLASLDPDKQYHTVMSNSEYHNEQRTDITSKYY